MAYIGIVISVLTRACTNDSDGCLDLPVGAFLLIPVPLLAAGGFLILLVAQVSIYDRYLLALERFLHTFGAPHLAHAETRFPIPLSFHLNRKVWDPQYSTLPHKLSWILYSLAAIATMAGTVVFDLMMATDAHPDKPGLRCGIALFAVLGVAEFVLLLLAVFKSPQTFDKAIGALPGAMRYFENPPTDSPGDPDP